MHERPLVYVAGPYTNPDPVKNTRAAVLLGDTLTGEGLCTAYVPHLSLFHHYLTPHPLGWWYEFDLTILRRCDALFRMPGESTGADAEVEFARTLPIPVFEGRQARARLRRHLLELSARYDPAG